MEPRDEKQTGEIFVADDIIKTAQELQAHIASLPYESQPQMAVEAMGILGDLSELYGSRKVLIHALGASVLFEDTEAMSLDQQFWHGTFIGDAYLRTNFTRFAFIQSQKVSGICLSLIETSILRSSSDPLLEGERIRTGVYVPVHAVETVLAA
jgi:hypothetical protein